LPERSRRKYRRARRTLPLRSTTTLSMRGLRSRKVRSTPMPFAARRRTVKLELLHVDHDAFELLNTFAGAFLDLYMDGDAIPAVQFGNVGVYRGIIGFQ